LIAFKHLRASLQAYVRGARKSGFMQNIAAQLSEAQIAVPVRTLSDREARREI
jgi:cytochrome c553